MCTAHKMRHSVAQLSTKAAKHQAISTSQAVRRSYSDMQISLHFVACSVGAGNLVGKEDPCSHAGEDHDPEWQELQVSGEDATPLDVGHVLGSEGALHDDLKS